MFGYSFMIILWKDKIILSIDKIILWIEISFSPSGMLHATENSHHQPPSLPPSTPKPLIQTTKLCLITLVLLAGAWTHVNVVE